jgi:putative membrane-bound dehydrogenase-like protein
MRARLVFALCLMWTLPLALRAESPFEEVRRGGSLPHDAEGRTLNLDFERGTLEDWTAEGDAFAAQPVEGDTVRRRRGDMASDHAGRFWIGTFERNGDGPQGTLVSRPFVVDKPYASFLIAGGPHQETRVELVRADSQQVIYRATGDETENLKPVVADLSEHLGQEIFIRLVDHHSGGWGHINFDDFRLHDERPNVPERVLPQPPDVFAHAGLDPEAAARAMSVPEGFHVTLFAGEPDVQQPIAMAIDDRGRLWIAEAYAYPIRVADEEARDRILIFHDTDGDGRFDERKVFISGLNLVSGLELGYGGVWVGAAPYLMFIPDRNRDDVPDGPPEIHLDGWAWQDTHETLNAFIWGPDGWLYGCHGVFTHSRVGTPGTPDEERIPINAGIWRYHPIKRRFEVFAHGTSNPWGIDFNDQGQAFCTACVIPHLFHVIQGARYVRQAGSHFNPHTYADIQTIARHRHWIGATPHSGNGRSDAAGGGHAHAGAMIYLGGAWPEQYRNQIFMNNIHGARINQDQLEPAGSGYVGDRAPDFLLANDAWSQILYLTYGPDGQVYMIDWYDKNQCHHGNVEGHDRSNGRIFKVSYGQPQMARIDLAALAEEELVDLQLHPNDWYVRHARRLLDERGASPQARQRLAQMAFEHADGTRRLRGLWALHVAGGLSPEHVARGLQHEDPYVRAWTIQLACEDGRPSAAVLARLAALAEADPSPVVRLYVASALQRLPLADRWEIAGRLIRHQEDAQDHNLPLMYWYAFEPLVAADPARALALAAEAVAPLPEFSVRRAAGLGTAQALAAVVEAIDRLPEDSARAVLLAAARQGLAGIRQVEMPPNWRALYRRLAASGDEQVRTLATALAITFGDATALDAMRQLVADRRGEPELREQALASLVKARDPKLPPILLSLVSDKALRRPALRALAAFDEPQAPSRILAAYADFDPDERRDALNTLAARTDYAVALLEAVGAGTVAAGDLSADLIRSLRNLGNERVNTLIGRVWGTVNDTPEERARLIAQYKALLTAPAEQPPDPSLGRAIFAKACQQCHVLFGTGSKIGPELTGSNRGNLDYILSNVLDPSALIGKDYLATLVQTTDGRVLTGLVRGEDENSLTLVTATETLVLPHDEIEVRQPSAQSMMPDDLFKPLSEHEVRSLVAYLASPQQVPMLATVENASSLFNGRDLEGWEGNFELWSVEGGEIVGRTSGLDHNEFLVSRLLVGDFELTLEVLLVDNQGNSGIQFRSEALPGGEVRGYQADIGAGWWGKLYEEHGRGLLWQNSGEPYVQPAQWNRYRIRAEGSRIRTWINDQLCVDLDDPQGARRGIIALQLHAGEAMEVRFRDLRLRVLTSTR